LKATAESTVSRCRICQEVKPPERVIGKLAPREAPLAPWDEVHVDCIGPWTIKLPGQQDDLVFDTLMCINPVPNIVELIRVESKLAEYIAMTMENNWLARYLRPQQFVHDDGPEFVGYEFKAMLYHNGIQDKPTAKLNPQSNAVCERMHRTVNAHIRITSQATSWKRRRRNAHHRHGPHSFNVCTLSFGQPCYSNFSQCNGFQP
jgi:hypothetical protein